MARVAIVEDGRHVAHAWPGHPERPDRVEAIRAHLAATPVLRDLPRLAARAGRRRGPAPRPRRRPPRARRRAVRRRGRPLRRRHLRDRRVRRRCAGCRGRDRRRRRGRGVRRVRRHVRGAAPARPPRHRRAGRWASASTTTSRWRWRTRAPCSAWSASPSSTSTCTTATAREATFWNDPHVLYTSLHQYPFYPGTGARQDRGGPEAKGLTVNVPLPAGTSAHGVARAASTRVVLPALRAFEPELRGGELRLRRAPRRPARRAAARHADVRALWRERLVALQRAAVDTAHCLGARGRLRPRRAHRLDRRRCSRCSSRRDRGALRWRRPCGLDGSAPPSPRSCSRPAVTAARRPGSPPTRRSQAVRSPGRQRESHRSAGASGVRTVLSPLGLNIRQSAAVTSARLGTAAQGAVLQVVGHTDQNGGWYQVQGQTVSGWITADPTLTAAGQFTQYQSQDRQFSALLPAELDLRREHRQRALPPDRRRPDDRGAQRRPRRRLRRRRGRRATTRRARRRWWCAGSPPTSTSTRMSGAPAATPAPGTAGPLALLAQIRLRLDASHALALDFNYNTRRRPRRLQRVLQLDDLPVPAVPAAGARARRPPERGSDDLLTDAVREQGAVRG